MTEHRVQRDDAAEADDWLKVLDRLPFVGSFKRDLTSLRRLLYERRAPRVAVVGVAKSGRTCLANALLNAATFGPDGAAPAPEPGAWVRIDADGRRLDWLEITAGELGVVEMARLAFDETVPDVLLGIVSAGAGDEEAKTVKDDLRLLREVLKDAYGESPKVVMLLSKVDVVPPAGEGPPYSEPKRHGIDLELQALREMMKDSLRALGLAEDAFIPFCARPHDNEPYDPRYNLQGVGEAILRVLPDQARIEAVRALEVSREARRDVGRTLVNTCSAIAVTIGLTPIPFADLFILLPLQAGMVAGVAYVSGRGWDKRAAAEWVASVGAVGSAGMGLRWGARQLVKLLPGAGSVVGAGIAGAGTLAIGRSAMAYFIDGPGSQAGRPELRADNPS